MYSLSKREFLPKVGETPDTVGPSTYYFDDYKVFKHTCIPFLSCTPRSKRLKKCDYGDAFYDVVLPYHIKGGSSVRNKSRREDVYQIPKGPGPADYDPPIPKRRPVPEPRPPGRGKLYLCTPPKGISSVPSIPSKIDENGYRIDDNGVCIKNPPDDYDTTLGPAFYNTKTSSSICNLYKGCAWSKRRAKRETTTISDKNPGPGEYDIPSTIGQFNARDEYVREMARLFGFVPRYLEAMELRLLKENKPGPGDYDINASTGKKNLSIYPRPFISGAKRWKHTDFDTPGPTDYDTQGNIKIQSTSKACVPFGYCAPRFVKKFTKSPSAAEYNVLTDTIQDKIRKKRQYFGSLRAPFNISAKRKMTFAPDDSSLTPSSADYVVEPLEVPKEAVANPNFKSRTCRFRGIKQPYQAGPATYNIAETFNKNRNRTSHNVSTLPFQSSQPKYTGRRIPDKPSPADYNSHKMFGGRDLSFNRALRWGDRYDDFPGPGTYNISPLYDYAMYKSYDSHNLRLKENVLRKKLRVPPWKTWETWCKELKKKRILRCYDREEEDIDFCALLFKDI